MGIKVCPYCEHEYIEMINRGETNSRPIGFEHFYPMGNERYPGLAMCFYNLIPSYRNCYHTKLEQSILLYSITIVLYLSMLKNKVTNELTSCLEQRY
ncbi:hypothetical protein L6471_03835 [Segatella bryantii]|uniref:hypothetical protein n=1 Tax=Segatella bryantii TaxID=77095 RepID=UPI001EDAA703|nr:hypothetical protein [Segatella bryantii]UKK74844.1 hypothetical protein L6471_03835 [Segatella bryantii]